jgi:NAD(P)-dependent dehydrogenase (short-subunit alcohol dehydrogenase family)
MRAAKRGNIIVIGATASLRGKPFTTAFASAKAAQRSLAQSLARQLGPEGIHVAVVIVDGMIQNRAGTSREEGSYLDPEDIAATVHHLASQPRSAWSFEVDVRPFKETW